MLEKQADFLIEPNVYWRNTKIGVDFYNLKKYWEEMLRELLFYFHFYFFCNSLLTNKTAAWRNKLSTVFLEV